MLNFWKEYERMFLRCLLKEYEGLKALGLKGLKVVFEDDEKIIADKPYNMLSQKASDKDVSANEPHSGPAVCGPASKKKHNV